MAWVVLYADSSTFSSEDGEPHEAPREGVVMVIKADALTGAATEPSIHGYWIWDTEWMGVDEWGFRDHLVHHPRPLALFGRRIPDVAWEGETKEFIAAELGVRKSAWRPRERRP